MFDNTLPLCLEECFEAKSIEECFLDASLDDSKANQFPSFNGDEISPHLVGLGMADNSNSQPSSVTNVESFLDDMVDFEMPKFDPETSKICITLSKSDEDTPNPC